MSSERVADLLNRNKNFHEPLCPPMIADISKKVKASGAGVSCSDPRVIPEQFLNFGRLEAAVIRNAGGRVLDAIRSLAMLDAIAPTKTIMIIHHSDCGATFVNDTEIKDVLEKRSPGLTAEIKDVDFGSYTDLDDSVRQDVAFLKSSPYVGEDVNILGYALELETGLLREVV